MKIYATDSNVDIGSAICRFFKINEQDSKCTIDKDGDLLVKKTGRIKNQT